MAPVFIFAEKVRSIVRSGKKEIEIPAGARISSAAAHMVIESQTQIKTVAPGSVSAGESTQAEDQSTEIADRADTKNQIAPPAEKMKRNTSLEDSAEISGDELEEIVDRVVERFRQLKGTPAEKTIPAKTAKADTQADAATDGADLVICRCEEITRGEIKDAIRNGIQTLNGIKRITRAGMGLCQGQTCQQLVARILAEELGFSANK